MDECKPLQLGEDEAADIAAQVMMEEDEAEGVNGGTGTGGVFVEDAEEAYEHEKAVLRAELEEIQALLGGAGARPQNASPAEMDKYAADLDRLKALLGRGFHSSTFPAHLEHFMRATLGAFQVSVTKKVLMLT